jgi:hypothetical protein
MARARVEGPFSRRALAWLVGVGASSLGLALALLATGAPESAEVASAGADAYSRSALGHRGFVALARAGGVPVLVSRYDSGRRAGSSGVLVIAEPRLPEADPNRARRLARMLTEARTALLVLPKWTGSEDPARPGWIGEASALPAMDVRRVLSAAGVAARLVRETGTGSERCEGLESPVTLPRPQLLAPTTERLKPLVSCPGGLLLGIEEREGLRLFVLSDPDLLANHGLGRGANAQAAGAIVALARAGEKALVLDETLHGHERVPALWRELFTFPLLPAVVQAALAALALLLAGLGRFGAPVEAGLGIAPGKGVLIENTAFLLRSAGHSGHTLGRYFDATVAEVARAVHAPPGAGPSEIRELLAAAARRRRVSVDLRTLEEQVERVRRQEAAEAAVVSTARRVFRLREEMLRGPQDHPGR